MTRFLRSPLVGSVLLAVSGGWALFAHPGAPESTSWAAACLVVAVGVLAGYVLGRADPALPGLLALGIAVGAVVVTAPASLSGAPLAPPLGYMNANGALLLGGAAGAVVAASPHLPAWRLGAAGAALVLTLVCLAEGAQAAAVACLGVTAWALLRRRGPSWAWVVVGAVSVAVPPLLTAGWASGVLPQPGVVVSAFSPERLSLWTEAWDLLVLHPLSGVGPGRFSQQAPTAADPDLRWAHSATLQTGAELGWVGVALLVLVVVWGLVALGRDGVLLGILLLPASVDYVLHFGGVLVVSSLVVGAALSSPGSDAADPSGAGKPWLTPPSP